MSTDIRWQKFLENFPSVEFDLVQEKSTPKAQPKITRSQTPDPATIAYFKKLEDKIFEFELELWQMRTEVAALSQAKVQSIEPAPPQKQDSEWADAISEEIRSFRKEIFTWFYLNDGKEPSGQAEKDLRNIMKQSLLTDVLEKKRS